MRLISKDALSNYGQLYSFQSEKLQSLYKVLVKT